MQVMTNKAGRIGIAPTRDMDDLEFMLRVRAFSRKAGIKAAATMLRKAGTPCHVARWILFTSDPVTLARIARVGRAVEQRS